MEISKGKKKILKGKIMMESSNKSTEKLKWNFLVIVDTMNQLVSTLFKEW